MRETMVNCTKHAFDELRMVDDNVQADRIYRYLMDMAWLMKLDGIITMKGYVIIRDRAREYNHAVWRKFFEAIEEQ